MADRHDGGFRQLRARADDTARLPRVHRARRSPRRGTDIAARATARAPARGAAARRARASGSSARPRQLRGKLGQADQGERAADLEVGEGAVRWRDSRSPHAAVRSGSTAAAAASSHDAPAGMAIEPLPNGQMPAMARNSVDLPEPDGPVISVRSPLRRLKASAETSGVPLGSRSVSPCRSIAVPPRHRRRESCRSSCSVAALAIPASNPSRRLTTACQSASGR